MTTARDSDRYLRTLNEIARYAGATLRHGGDIQRTIEESKIFRIPMPSRPTPVDEDSNEEEILVHEFETDVYQEKVKNFVKRKSTLQDNMSKMYSLLWGQCSEPMRAKVKAMLTFEVVKEQMDMIGLLDLIRKSTFDFHSQGNNYHAMIEIQKAQINFRQPKDMSNGDYYEKFNSLAEAYESCGGSFDTNLRVLNNYCQKKTI